MLHLLLPLCVLSFLPAPPPLMYFITWRLAHAPTPAVVSVALSALLPVLQKSSFPGLLAPSVFEPFAAAAVSLAYLRLMEQPTARRVALLVVALVATAATCETFIFIMCTVSVVSLQAVLSSRVDKVCKEERSAQVTCVIDVLAVTGCYPLCICLAAQYINAVWSKCALTGVVILALCWIGFPLALPPQSAMLVLVPLLCFVVIFMYGHKAVEFYFTSRVVRKPVISTRAAAVISFSFLISAALAVACSVRVQAPPFPSTNVIRCARAAPLTLPYYCDTAPENTARVH
jgi:hypothetical protein